MARERKGKRPPRKGGGRRRDEDCGTLRLAIVVGRRGDAALDGAISWLIARAAALGGPFRVWVDRTAASPLNGFRDHDITGGRQVPGAEQYRLDFDRQDLGIDGLLADYRNCRGRIEELVIFHHGTAVEESALADRLRDIINVCKVPVCRVVWWACDAAVALGVKQDEATDLMMRILGAITRCRPCGCRAPIELIWPTIGRCYLTGAGAAAVPQTNDGKVMRARWGYRQPDGSLGLNPAPGDPRPSPEPPDRDPPYGQDPAKVDGSFLGVPVGRRIP